MRKIVVLAALAAMLPTSAHAQTGRFEADNPWFQDFQETCRIGDDAIQPECEEGVLMGYAEISGKTGVSCDWTKFWAAADERDSDVFRVLPWQYAVEEIFRVEGVCAVED